MKLILSILFVIFLKLNAFDQNTIDSTKILTIDDVRVSFARIATEGKLTSDFIRRTQYLLIENDSLNRFKIKEFLIGSCCVTNLQAELTQGNKISDDMINWIINCPKKEFPFWIEEIILIDRFTNEEYMYNQTIKIIRLK